MPYWFWQNVFPKRRAMWMLGRLGLTLRGPARVSSFPVPRSHHSGSAPGTPGPISPCLSPPPGTVGKAISSGLTSVWFSSQTLLTEHCLTPDLSGPIEVGKADRFGITQRNQTNPCFHRSPQRLQQEKQGSRKPDTLKSASSLGDRGGRGSALQAATTHLWVGLSSAVIPAALIRGGGSQLGQERRNPPLGGPLDDFPQIVSIQQQVPPITTPIPSP